VNRHGCVLCALAASTAAPTIDIGSVPLRQVSHASNAGPRSSASTPWSYARYATAASANTNAVAAPRPARRRNDRRDTCDGSTSSAPSVSGRTAGSCGVARSAELGAEGVMDVPLCSCAGRRPSTTDRRCSW
jgi:hypothetical protein